jgi:PilZ domain
MKFLKKLIQQLLPTESLPADERRSSVRLNFVIGIKVQIEDQTHPATIVNLTFTGLCIQLAIPLEEGQEITLVRDDFGPSFKGSVLWSKPGKDGSNLIGIECELDEERLIDSWLEPALVQAGFEANYVDEQRRLVRVPGRVKCELQSLEGKPLGTASMMDLSLGGALLESDVEFSTNTTLAFKTLPQGALQPLQGEARVLSTRAGDSGTFLCGLIFTKSVDKDVQSYMNSMLASETA